MSYNLNRRKFISSIGTIAVGLPFGVSALNILPIDQKVGRKDSNDFNFVLFGDMHFDALKYHDFDYVRKQFSADDVRQQKEYSRITSENLPKLLEASKEWANKTNAKFYLQLGDLVEGLAGSKELATGQVSGLIQYLSQEKLGRPFISVKGNHDVTGVGSKETYLDTVIPWQNDEMQHSNLNWQQLQTELSLNLANKSFVYNGARFVLYDCFNEASLDWFKIILKEHNIEQPLFFCTHVPVVPYDDRSTWHIFNRQPEMRAELLSLLGKYQAIVLSAHLHKFSLVTRNTPFGNFVQVGIGSVMYNLNAPIKSHLQGLEAYNTELVNLEPNFSPATLQERKDVLTKEKPYIRSYEYADITGFGVVKVSDEVKLTIFVNTDKKPWKTVSLTQLLKA